MWPSVGLYVSPIDYHTNTTVMFDSLNNSIQNLHNHVIQLRQLITSGKLQITTTVQNYLIQTVKLLNQQIFNIIIDANTIPIINIGTLIYRI
jgi:hypothetical protein